MSAEIRKALSDGPATVKELQAETGYDTRRIAICLWSLTRQGHVTQIGRTVNSERRQGAHRNLKLYALTPRGVWMLANGLKE